MKSILSTKKLSPSQRELALNAKLRLVEYDAIQIQLVDFEILEEFDCLLFTSQNAVRSFLKKKKLLSTVERKVLGIRAICIGEKTSSLLSENGFQVLVVATNAEELGQIILEKFSTFSFLFLCGNLRMETLPSLFKKNNIRYKELMVYKTVANTRQFKREFDMVLFYSPSGVQSFTAMNHLGASTAICIGPTTLAEAESHTTKLVKANKPTVENVIVQAVKFAANL